MSILDKISNMFGSKREEESIATPVEPVASVAPVDDSTEPTTPDISPQPGLITPEGETHGEEPAQEDESGEGKINLSL